MSAHHPPTTSHNHEKKIKAMLQAKQHQLLPGQEMIAESYHDKWCDVFDGGFCNCDPEITLHAPISIINLN